ncbi:hypothetical protein HZA87_04625 [Candidatus Uhrbacteria bacterium]|nr:hypothetical protein [Candidatus Uhrbacteria bacterium]
MEKKRPKGKEAMTSLLRMIDNGTTEAMELFHQSASRRQYRLDPEEQLAVDRMKERREHRNRLAYLKRKKLIKTKKIERRLFVELSNQGRLELMTESMQEHPRLPDGYVCLVLYDVPVDAKSGRDAFRYFLKNIGFEQEQQSVWKTDRDVLKEVKEFVISARLQKWVTIYLGKKQC